MTAWELHLLYNHIEELMVLATDAGDLRMAAFYEKQLDEIETELHEIKRSNKDSDNKKS